MCCLTFWWICIIGITIINWCFEYWNIKISLLQVRMNAPTSHVHLEGNVTKISYQAIISAGACLIALEMRGWCVAVMVRRTKILANSTRLPVSWRRSSRCCTRAPAVSWEGSFVRGRMKLGNVEDSTKFCKCRVLALPLFRKSRRSPDAVHRYEQYKTLL